MKRILVGIDGSDCSLRAVKFCGLLFEGSKEISLTLLHVLPYMPPRIWDIGHILSEKEKEAQRDIMERWLDDQKQRTEPMFRKARDVLGEGGFDDGRVEEKVISDSTDVAGSILEEARDGGYLTLVLGRCGTSGLQGFFQGSTTSRIVNRGAGLAICLVE